MSVLTYLQQKSASAVLSQDEARSIETSIMTLSQRLGEYFIVDGDKLSRTFLFGSATRGTILPRRFDQSSDVDYMIVFQKGGLTPQAYLDRLKRFAEQRYGTSELYQSNPTVVLELNHIKFDLVPALHANGTIYSIPDGSAGWRATNPNDFNATLQSVDNSNYNLIKPTIRLAKIWNASSSTGKVYDSFLLEKWILERNFSQARSLRDYLFVVFDALQGQTGTQWRDDKVRRAKQIIQNVRAWEAAGQADAAEQEIRKLL